MKFFREPINTLTHLIGAVLSVVALILMIVYSSFTGKVFNIISVTVFGITLILLYTASTLYHWLKVSENGIKILKKIDHIMIYFLIAGTYTPVCLIPLMKYGWGWTMFGIIWGLAIIGLVREFLWKNAPRWISTVIYIGMGWMAVIAIKPMMITMSSGSLFWLMMGGVFYTVGAVIYAIKKPNLLKGLFGFHEIWHCFVISGSFCHFWMTFKYVIYMG